MTQEEKHTLLVDLCARLPYHLLGKDTFGKTRELKIVYPTGTIIAKEIDGECCSSCGFVPYLRPMSSMTEEEKEELRQEHIKDEKLFAECLTKAANGDSSIRGKVVPHFAADWCNKNHFDYRGLIPMGLALKAPEGMYGIKTE